MERINITYEIPKLDTLQIENKLPKYSGKDYPLRDLEHREFERLIYALYSQEIIDKKIPFDSIMLMNGIKDKGQDCALFLDNTKTGIIQCKHSENDTKAKLALCIKEIIKFVLYSFQETHLIPNINFFTYYFASSAGFETLTEEYLRTFGENISKEKHLKKWAEEVIKNSKSLENLEFENIKTKLKFTLTHLVVKPITPAEIQRLLLSHSTTVVPGFYEVQMVIDSKSIKEIKDELKGIKKLINSEDISESKIIEEFKTESFFLANYKSWFSLKKPKKIERKVTGDILDWIKRPLEADKENIAIVKGGAGCGKSVILNNLYNSLTKNNIPAIAIKADIKSADSIMELERKINLSIPLEKGVKILLTTYEKVVVIIDQIDALSQSLSANRTTLTTYISLIENLKKIDRIRVVISVREYDLNYDPYLVPFQKNTQFDVSFLKTEEVIEVLKELKMNSFNERLLKLLSTPLHLELFCQIYSGKQGEPKFFSLYDLYTELWVSRIETNRSRDLKERLKQTLYKIASKIYERKGNLSVSSSLFDKEDVEYLLTEGMLFKVKGTRELTFFHQTFYDYVFAKHFVEEKRNVIEYIKQNNQDLSIRSSLKIILSHLRENNPQQYKDAILNLLNSIDTRFHIKQLIFNYLGFVEEPDNVEADILESAISKTSNEIVFYESVNSIGWVKYIIKAGRLKNILESENDDKINAVYHLLLRNRNNSNSDILKGLINLSVNAKNDNIIAQYLYYIEQWNSDAILLYNRTIDTIQKSDYHFCNCMRAAIKYDEDWAYLEIEKRMLDKSKCLSKGGNKLDIEHNEVEFFKELLKQNQEKPFRILQKTIENVIKLTAWRVNPHDLYEDIIFTFFTSSNQNHYGDDEELYQLFINQVEEFSRNSSPLFDALIIQYSASEYSSLLRILIHGYLANPEKYWENAYLTLKYIYYKNGFNDEEKLQYFIRKLIAIIYPLLSTLQKRELNSMLLSIGDKSELGVSEDPVTKKKHVYSRLWYRQYKFLCVIPQDEIKSFPEINKRFQELNRKYGRVNDREPNKMSVKVGRAPYKTSIYEKMSLKDWENTFYKYNEAYKSDFFLDTGGMIEHARIFEEQVSKRPAFFLPLIIQAMDNDKISNYYKSYGINGLIKAKYDTEIILSLISMQIRNKLDNTIILYTIWSISYLIEHKKVNSFVFNFLCKQAISNTDPQKDDFKDPMHRAINSVRGAAIDRLMKGSNEEYEIKLFRTLNKVIRIEKTFAVKVAVIHNSAYLLNINKRKAFNIFSRLLISDKRLIKEAMWSAGYFSNFYFQKMNFLLQIAVKDKRVYKWVANMLVFAWLKNIKESEKYLFQLLKKSIEARVEIAKIAVHQQNLINDNGALDKKCVYLYCRELNSKDNKIAHEYSVAFLRYKPDMFNALFPLLIKYSKSKVFKASPGNFCRYIIECCSTETVYKCAELITQFDSLSKPDITHSNYYDSEPLNLILGIYNVLGNSSEDEVLKNKCMDMFDKMLQQPQHRNAAYKATSLSEF